MPDKITIYLVEEWNDSDSASYVVAAAFSTEDAAYKQAERLSLEYPAQVYDVHPVLLDETAEEHAKAIQPFRKAGGAVVEMPTREGNNEAK